MVLCILRGIVALSRIFLIHILGGDICTHGFFPYDVCNSQLFTLSLLIIYTRIGRLRSFVMYVFW